MTPQLALDLSPAPRWGGARVRAGRPRKHGRHDSAHRARPVHAARTPVHVVYRTLPDVGRLRRRRILDAIRRALRTVAFRSTFRVVHLSIQHNHLHLLVEAETARDLSRGLQAFAISAARAINKAQARTGKVFAFRYHATPITGPRQARHALAYVLNNWRRHHEDLRERSGAALDKYSSAISFPHWRDFKLGSWPRGYEPLLVTQPMTWLLREGWLRAGPPLDTRRVPGPTG